VSLHAMMEKDLSTAAVEGMNLTQRWRDEEELLSLAGLSMLEYLYLNLRTLCYNNTCISTIHHADGRVSDMETPASGLV
jgi:hypothetical protein